MSDHSARPRIESVGTFVLTIPEESEAPDECLTFDEGDFTPTYTVIGEAGGTSASDAELELVLTDDALVTTEDDTYTLAVVILSSSLGDPPATLSHSDSWTISDDAVEDVPEYLKFDPEWVEGEETFDCFSGIWRHKTLFDGNGGTTQYDWCEEGDPGLEGKYYNTVAHVGYRALQSELPAGTTITMDPGGAGAANRVWQAKALLIKNAALYTSTPKGINDDWEVADFYDEGGVLFTFSYGNNSRGAECGIFISSYSDGIPRQSHEGDEILTEQYDVIHQYWHPEGDGGPSGMDCDCSEMTQVSLAKVHVTCIAPGGGDYAVDAGDLSFDAGDILSGVAYPAQGYY